MNVKSKWQTQYRVPLWKIHGLLNLVCAPKNTSYELPFISRSSNPTVFPPDNLIRRKLGTWGIGVGLIIFSSVYCELSRYRFTILASALGPTKTPLNGFIAVLLRSLSLNLGIIGIRIDGCIVGNRWYNTSNLESLQSGKSLCCQASVGEKSSLNGLTPSYFLK